LHTWLIKEFIANFENYIGIIYKVKKSKYLFSSRRLDLKRPYSLLFSVLFSFSENKAKINVLYGLLI
jgi:hypothetical protein